ncbi:hypothetical protein AAG747_23670 [Rapidithrix thailandica]|uniref:Lipoprotein n=1 Tax=Rapidithrix thailandica TaxID=413964 RepID=A0AAW9SGJ5_9BACT
MTTKRQLLKLCMIAWGITLSLSMSSCKDDDDTAPEDRASRVQLKPDATHGTILTDGNGVTLYVFSPDVTGESECTGGCLDRWPIYYAVDMKVGEGLDASDFATVTHSNGEKQTTYKGWPLYYYAPGGDGKKESAGMVTGEGVGNVWFVAKPDYSLMIAKGQLVGKDEKNYKSDYTEGEEQTVYFTDGMGRALYIFINDTKDKNNYTKEDFSNDATWPIFHVAVHTLPSILNQADFGEIDVFGKKQLTFKGWPLYYFGGDAQRGETKGVSVPVPGVWPVVNGDLAEAE